MANVSMNLGDKLIFDANDATNPSTTYLTNPATATNPNNRVEIWCNGAKRAEFQNTKTLLAGDLEFSSPTPRIRSTSGPLAFDISPGYDVTIGYATGTPLFAMGAPGLSLSETPVKITGSTAATRTISGAGGDFTVDGTHAVIIRADAKGLHAGSDVQIFKDTTLVAKFDNYGATVTGYVFAWGDLLAAGNVVPSGVVDGSSGGLRSKRVTTDPPPGSGSNGDILVNTTNHKLWINMAGTWRSVTLT